MKVYVLLHKPHTLAEDDEPYVVDAIDEHSLDAGCVWDGDLSAPDLEAKHGEGQYRQVIWTVSGSLLNTMFKPMHLTGEGVAPVESTT